MTPGELFASCAGVILDFDGPMAALMPPPHNRQAADAVRAAVQQPLPTDLADVSDHIAVLRHVLDDPQQLRAAHEAATQAEVDCGRRCQPAPWLVDLLANLDATGREWAVATNNSVEAVHAFLDRFDVPRPVAIEGRTLKTMHQLKPDHHLVTAAAQRLGLSPGTLVFVGDSVSDVIAGRAAGVPVLGYAKNSERATSLLAAGAVAVTRP